MILEFQNRRKLKIIKEDLKIISGSTIAKKYLQQYFKKFGFNKLGYSSSSFRGGMTIVINVNKYSLAGVFNSNQAFAIYPGEYLYFFEKGFMIFSKNEGENNYYFKHDFRI